MSSSSGPSSARVSLQPDVMDVSDIPAQLDRRYDLYEFIRPAHSILYEFIGLEDIDEFAVYFILQMQKELMVSTLG